MRVEGLLQIYDRSREVFARLPSGFWGATDAADNWRFRNPLDLPRSIDNTWQV
jgi:hypothetical protein